MKFNVKELTYIGVFSALVLVGSFINFIIPFAPQGGLVHLGTTVSVIAIIVSGRKIGTLSGTIGMTVFDIIGGWLIWAPGTFIARIGLGYIMGSICYKGNREGKSLFYNLLGLILGGLWMIFIYYIYEAIIYSNFITPIASISANILQLALAGVIGIPIGMILRRQNLL